MFAAGDRSTSPLARASGSSSTFIRRSTSGRVGCLIFASEDSRVVFAGQQRDRNLKVQVQISPNLFYSSNTARSCSWTSETGSRKSRASRPVGDTAVPRAHITI